MYFAYITYLHTSREPEGMGTKRGRRLARRGAGNLGATPRTQEMGKTTAEMEGPREEGHEVVGC